MPIDINLPLKLANVTPPNTSFLVEPPGGGTAVPKIQGQTIDWGSTVLASANASADLQGDDGSGGALQVVNFDNISPVTITPDWSQVTSVDEYYYDGTSSDYVTTVETNGDSVAVTIRG